jgi:hypothetical protein
MWLIALAALAVVLTPASASARAVPIASYCSPTGDLCYGIFNRSGKVHLTISTAARYFKRYNVCVRPIPLRSGPKYAERCGSFPLFRQSGSTWGSSVNYARQYPLTFAGTYRVVWKLGSQPLGPPLRFRLPLVP